MGKYDYDTKYSLKYIYDDFSLFELRDWLEELKKINLMPNSDWELLNGLEIALIG